MQRAAGCGLSAILPVASPRIWLFASAAAAAAAGTTTCVRIAVPQPPPQVTVQHQTHPNITRDRLEALPTCNPNDPNQYSTRYGWGSGVRLYR